MAITTAISDLFASFYELFASIIGTMYSMVHALFSAVVNFVTGIFTLIADVLGGFVEMAGGIGKFLASKHKPISLISFLRFFFAFFCCVAPLTSIVTESDPCEDQCTHYTLSQPQPPMRRFAPGIVC
ncbi:hypothetical protein CC79DRAFT_1333842 [Sarocladium strictum]